MMRGEKKEQPPLTAKELGAQYIYQRTQSGVTHEGLTKREWYAGLAMQGLCGNAIFDSKHPSSPRAISDMSVEYADALLAELVKTKP